MWRNTVAVLGFAFIGLVFSSTLDYVWLTYVLAGVTFRQSEPVLLDVAAMALWVPVVLAFVPCGAVMARFVTYERYIFWTGALGIVASLLYWSVNVVVTSTAGALEVFWANSVFGMPFVGSLLGGVMAAAANKSLNADALERAG